MSKATSSSQASTISDQTLEQIAAKSIIDCHVKGLDSLMFHDKPGARVRAFVTNENHELWKNHPRLDERLSIALHPHHCNVVLVPIYGNIYNVIVDRNRGNERKLRKFKYQSPIAKVTADETTQRFEIPAQGKFEEQLFEWRTFQLLAARIRKSWYMQANQLHTVYVPKGDRVAWFVFELEEDWEYKSICYSDDDLEKFDFSKLYKPMLGDRVEKHLARFTHEAFDVIANPIEATTTFRRATYNA